MHTSDLGTADGYGRVADAFEKISPRDGVHGAGLSVWVEGVPVVALVGGIATPRDSVAWKPTTMAPIHSCTKGLTSLAIAMLIERGSLASFDVPLREFWPEFGRHGKDSITVGDALAHRGGVSAPRASLPREKLLDGHSLAEALAAQKPLWVPGESHQYHTLTHGVFAEQLMRRIDGRSVGEFLRDEVAHPLDADLALGATPAEMDGLARPGSVGPGDPDAATPPNDSAEYWVARAGDLGGELPLSAFATDMAIYRGELGAAGGIASAEGLARAWSATVVETRGVRLISDETIAALVAPRSVGEPQFGGPPPYQHWGAGVMIPSDWQPYLGATSFGHDGGGGQIAFADGSSRLGFGFVTTDLGDWDRGKSVIAAVAESLG